MHDWKNPWFGVIVSVCSDAEIDFVRIRVLTVLLVQSEERVCGGLRNDVGRESGLLFVGGRHVCDDLLKT